jgi:hypothetical protein
MNCFLSRSRLISSNILRAWHLKQIGQRSSAIGIVPQLYRTESTHFIVVIRQSDVKEAGPALLLARVGLPEEVLLGVAGHLRRGPGGDEVLGDTPPAPFAQLPQAVEKLPVLLLGPRNPCQNFTVN